MSNPLYQWQLQPKVGNHYPVDDPDAVYPVQTVGAHGKQPVATYDELRGKRPKDIDIGKTAWRLRKVTSSSTQST